MARTLVNAHQLAPFSGSTAVQVKVDSNLYNGPGSGDAKDASLNLLSGSLTEMGTLYFTNGTTGVGGSIAYESSAFQFYGASRFQLFQIKNSIRKESTMSTNTWSIRF